MHLGFRVQGLGFEPYKAPIKGHTPWLRKPSPRTQPARIKSTAKRAKENYLPFEEVGTGFRVRVHGAKGSLKTSLHPITPIQAFCKSYRGVLTWQVLTWGVLK